MTLRNWLLNTGSWSDPAQWNTGLPGTGDIASFGSGTYDVTFATTATIDGFTEGVTGATLDIASGLLVLRAANLSSAWGGSLRQQGGTVVLAGRTLVANGSFLQTDGTVSLAAGTWLNLPSAATLSGTIAGFGTLAIGGTTTLDGATLAQAGLTLGATGTLVLASDAGFAGLAQSGGANYQLGGHSLTLSGAASLSGGQIAGPGTLALAGLANLASPLLRGATIAASGTVTVDGLAFGSGSGDHELLAIAPGGVVDLRTDVALPDNGGGSIANAGLLEKTVGAFGVLSNIAAAVASTGTLRVGMGTLLLTNSGTGTLLGGTLDGPGTLRIGGNATLDAGAIVNVGTLATGFGGTLTLAGNAALTGNLAVGAVSTLVLAGNSLSTQGLNSLAGIVNAQGTTGNTGTLVLGGVTDLKNVTFTGGTLWLEDAGLVTQSGFVSLGTVSADHVAMQIDAGAAWHVQASSAGNSPKLFAFNNGTTLTAGVLNNGLFWYDAGGGGHFNVDSAFANNIGGTLLVSKGDLRFQQSFINDGSGEIDGSASFAGGLQASTFNTGTLTIGTQGTISVTGAVNAGSTIDFADGNGLLVVNTASLFTGTITHFRAGSTIDFVGVKANQLFRAGPDFSLDYVVNNGTTVLASFTNLFPDVTMRLTGDGNGGTKLVGTPPDHIFNGAFVGPLPTVSWTLGGSASGSWFTDALWSVGGAPTNGLADVSISTAGGTIFYNGGATVDTLGASGTTLDMTGGELFVNNGGTWVGHVEQTAGAIVSVTGLTINNDSYQLGVDGRLESDSGTIRIQSSHFNAQGILRGPGTIEQTTGTLTPSPLGAISVGTLRIDAGATFVPYDTETIDNGFMLFGNMPLFGGSVRLAGASVLAGTVTDAGTIVVGGTADVSSLILGGTTDLLQVDGHAVETSGDVGGNGVTTITVSAIGGWDIQADSGIFLGAGTGTLTNAGLLEKTGGVGTARIQARFTSTGTLRVASGTLQLQSGAADLAGTVDGAGMLDATNVPSTLEADTFLNVGGFLAGTLALGGDIAYLGTLTASRTISLLGHTLDLGNTAELAGVIAGSGLVRLNKADVNGLTVTGADTVLRVGRFVTQSSGLVLGGGTADSVTLAIAAAGSLTPAGTYDIVSDNNIGGTFSGVVAGTIANAGLFEKTGGGGNATLFARLANTGTVIADHGTLTLNGAATNDGTIAIPGVLLANGAIAAEPGQVGTIVLGPAGTLVVNGAIGADQTITYDPGGLIKIAQPGSFAATIQGFVPGDRIMFTNTTAIDSVSYAGGVIALGHNNAGTIIPQGTIIAPSLSNPAGLTVSTDGTNVFLAEVACFAEGTRILTVAGEVPIERLAPGMAVPCVASGAVRRVVWTGRRCLSPARHSNPASVHPIRIDAGAFADGVPHRDVTVSPDHAVLVGDWLIPARLLVNGRSIRQVEIGEITYWHVELDAHDAVLAEGLAVETYLDTGNRHAFDGAGALALRPDFGAGRWDAAACRALALGGPAVMEAWRRLDARARLGAVGACRGDQAAGSPY